MENGSPKTTTRRRRCGFLCTELDSKVKDTCLIRLGRQKKGASPTRRKRCNHHRRRSPSMMIPLRMASTPGRNRVVLDVAARHRRHRVDQPTIRGRSRANLGHYKSLFACVNRTFGNRFHRAGASRKKSASPGRYAVMSIARPACPLSAFGGCDRCHSYSSNSAEPGAADCGQAGCRRRHGAAHRSRR
jgi:hypothetical protein